LTIGSSIFKRKRNGKLAKRWTVQLRMPDGTLVQRVGFTDKGATRQLEARMVREAERKEVGLHDQFGKAKRTPLHDHIDAFLLAMQSGTLARRRHGKPTDRWIERVRRRLAYLFRLLGASRLEHLSQGEAETVLVERVRAGWSDKTRDDHAALLRQFGSWLVDDQRAAVNPFHRLRPTRNEASKTFRRHALTVAELEQLVAAAEVRGPQQYAKVNPWAAPEHVRELEAKGRERATLYQVAAYTGLRRGELCALVWDDVRLGSEPAIDVRAGTTKSKRRARLELPAWLGALLQQMRARRAAILGGPPPAHERLFAATSYRHITDQLRADAIFARLGRLDPESGRVLTDGGKTIDLHALRGTLATLAAEVGMPVKLLQQHMRHSDIRITMEVYAQVRSGAMREQVELLPAPVQRKAAKEGQA
jgi:integrase